MRIVHAAVSLPRIRLSVALLAAATTLGTSGLAAALERGGGFSLTEDFDGVAAPALPEGWTSARASGTAADATWATSTNTPDTSPNCALVGCPARTTDMRLVTPLWTVLTADATLSFRHAYNIELGFDGGVLDISLDGGTFVDVLAAGCTFVSPTQGYSGTISTDFSSLIAGRAAFTGNSGGYVTSTLALPAGAIGQTVQFRFRFVSDNSIAGVGWRVDSLGATGIDPCALICPTDLVVNADPGSCSAFVNYDPPTGENCGKYGCGPGSGTEFSIGETVVSCSNGSVSCEFSVVVRDREDPVINCPANISVEAAANSCGAAVTYAAPTATDNCAGVSVTSDPPSGVTFPIGTTTVTCRARDASGNTSTCTFTVTVADVTSPGVACPAGFTVNTDAGACTAQVAYPSPTITDACAGSVFAFDPPAGTALPVGVTTINCTATDRSGNTSMCTFDVTVRDGEAPVVTAPAEIVIAADENCELAIDDLAGLFSISDNCTPREQLSISQVPAAGAFVAAAAGTITLRVTDAAGNATEVTAAITIDAGDCVDLLGPDIQNCGACGNLSAGLLLTAWAIPPLWWMKRGARRGRRNRAGE